MLHNPNVTSGRGAIANFHIKRDTTLVADREWSMPADLVAVRSASSKLEGALRIVDAATGKTLDEGERKAALAGAHRLDHYAGRPGPLTGMPDGCDPIEFGSMILPPRFFGYCSATLGGEQRFVLWSPGDIRTWTRPAVFLDHSDRKSITSPVMSARGELAVGEAGEEWLDLERRVLFVTPAIVPIDLTQVWGTARQFVGTEPKWPDLLEAVDLERETIDYVGQYDCPGYLVLRDHRPGFFVVGCEVKHVAYGDGVWSEVIDLKSRTRWHTTIGIHALTANNLPIAHRLKDGRHEIITIALGPPPAAR